MELDIMSQDRTILGSFDIIEIDSENTKKIVGWSCHVEGLTRVLGIYDSEKIAKEVLDSIRTRENSLHSNNMEPNVFTMPSHDGR